MRPEPLLKEGAKAWILVCGAHHISFSYEINSEQLTDLANIYGIESLVIDKDTTIKSFNNELKWNNLYWALKR